jgi:hypothetical protein
MSGNRRATEGGKRIMAQDFNELINRLHSQLTDTTAEGTNIITINSKRQFIPGENFDTVIAFAGDINSQIITFKCVKIHDGHDLSSCEFKELKWKNLTSLIEGVSKLEVGTTSTDSFELRWEVPAELCTQAGQVEISLQIYDKSQDYIVFSWNTSVYRELSIGGSMDTVGLNFPPRDEILLIDKDTKQILSPAKYNNIICNYGDVGVANVYFLVDRYLGKNKELDVTESEITIYVLMNGHKKKDNINISTKLYTEEISERGDGLVLIDWAVPGDFTAGEYGANELTIALEFVKKENGTIIRRWFSNPYTKLKVGESLIQIEVEPGDPAITEDTIYSYIENYFETHEIIWDAN